MGHSSRIEIGSMLYSCEYGTIALTAQKCRCATVLRMGWVLWTVMGTLNADASASMRMNSVKPGTLTMSGARRSSMRVLVT